MNLKFDRKFTRKVVNQIITFTLLAVCLSVPITSQAHHSFAIYDFSIQTEFKGEVKSIKFRNPHISMFLNHHEADGSITEVEFIEGAPANMLVRSGLRPNMLAEGETITVVGSPLREDPTKFFIQKIILADGSEF